MPLAMAHWLEGRYTDAYQILSLPGVEKACTDIWIYHNLIGMTCRQMDGLISQAQAAYRRSLTLDPDRADTLYNYANLLKEDFPEESLDYYQRSVNIEPFVATAWHNFGSALNSCNQHEKALTCLRISLKIDPLVADVWCNLGLSYFGLEQYISAEQCFRHAISLDGHAPSYTNLGNTLINLLQPEEALLYLEKGFELDKSSKHSLWNLALAYLLLGEFGKGWAYYESRFDNKDFDDVSPPTCGPRLSDLSKAPTRNDSPLVVWSEQGIGDVIQFCRYLYLLDSMDVPFVFLQGNL